MPGKRGRPPKPADEVLTDRFELRLTALERSEYERCAKRAKISLAAWIRDRLAKVAKREI